MFRREAKTLYNQRSMTRAAVDGRMDCRVARYVCKYCQPASAPATVYYASHVSLFALNDGLEEVVL